MADIGSLIQHNYKEVDKRDALNSVVGWLTGDDHTAPPIVADHGRPYGIITDRALIRRAIDGNAKVENFTLPTGALSFDSSFEDARKRMAEHRASYLPVRDERDKTAGYVRALDVARAQQMRSKASELSFPVPALKEEQTMGEAVNVFHAEYIDVLPVLNQDGRITGTLPRRTVISMSLNSGNRGRKDAAGEKFHILNDPIRGFMDTTPPALVPPSADFDRLMETIEDRGYAFVGEREGRLTGVVTPETIFRAK